MTTKIDLSNFSSISATQPAGFVSDKYSWISTLTIVETLEKYGWIPVRASQDNTREYTKKENGELVPNPHYGFQKHMVRFRNPSLEPIKVKGNGEFQKENIIFPELVGVNAHDGSTKFRFFGGLYREICSNGLTVDEMVFSAITIKHIGSVEESVKQIVEYTGEVVPKMVSKVQEFNSVVLSYKEQEMFGRAALIAKHGDNEKVLKKYDVEALIAPKRLSEQDPTLWNTYNTVQERLVEKGGRFQYPTRPHGWHDRKKTRGIKSIGENIRMNRALWSLAEEMVRLKNLTELNYSNN